MTDPVTVISPAAHSLRSPVRASRRPSWLLWLLVACLLCSVMPAIHQHVFGSTRVQEAGVDQVEEFLGVELGGGARDALRQGLAQRSPWGEGATAVAGTLIGVVLAGMVLQIGSLFALAEISAVQTLEAAALANLSDTCMRVAIWLLNIVVRGVAGAPAASWQFSGAVGLARFVRGTHGITGALVHAVDLTVFIGVVVGATSLMISDAKLPFSRALLIAAGWPAISIILRAFLFLAAGLAA